MLTFILSSLLILQTSNPAVALSEQEHHSTVQASSSIMADDDWICTILPWLPVCH